MISVHCGHNIVVTMGQHEVEALLEVCHTDRIAIGNRCADEKAKP